MDDTQPHVTIDRVPDPTWGDCVRLTNGVVDVRLATTFGPRIVHYGLHGGDNVFGVAGEPVDTALGAWHPRGGHRLWMAPEHMPRSYAPDDAPVTVAVSGDTVSLIGEVESGSHLQKQLDVTLAPSGTEVTVRHRLVNHGAHETELAPWALTIMAPGGVVIVPQEPFAPHPALLLPVRAVALWAFTDLSDPRWTIGPQFLRLRPDATRPAAQKIGVANRQGWAAYHRDDLLFVKRFDWNDGARYPDFGVNTETFTAGAFVELETLGRLEHLAPGAEALHEERWFLCAGVACPDDDDDLAAALGPALRLTR